MKVTASPRPSYYMGGRGQVLEDGVPELRNRKDIYMQAASELGTRGLLAAALSGMVSEQGMWQSITMPLGNRFLDFISRPRIQYAAALNRRLSPGVVPCSECVGRSHKYRTRLTVRPRPTFCIPKHRKLRAADCGLRFRSSSGATLGRLVTTCRGNSKSLANLLCAYAVPDDARPGPCVNWLREPNAALIHGRTPTRWAQLSAAVAAVTELPRLPAP